MPVVTVALLQLDAATGAATDVATEAEQQPKQQPRAAAQTPPRAARTPCGTLDARTLPHGPNTPEGRMGGRARRASGEGAGTATAQFECVANCAQGSEGAEGVEGAEGAEGATGGGAAEDAAGEERGALERHLAEQRLRLDAERAALKARRASRGSLSSPFISRASSVASLDNAAASDVEADDKEVKAPASDKKGDARSRREAGADGDSARAAKLPRMSPDAKTDAKADAKADAITAVLELADAITPAVLGMGSPAMVPAGVQELVAQRLSRARKQNRGARHAKRAEGLAA